MATDEEALQQTRDFFKDAMRLGITSVQSMSLPAGSERCLFLYENAPTPIRMRVIRMALTSSSGRDTKEGRSLPHNPTPLITVSGTKWLLDGSPIERTAALRKPYSDRPSTSGELDFSGKEMEAMLREALENNDQLLVHTVGDRSTETFLNAMDATGGKQVWSKRRVRIEHGDGVMPDLIARTKELGLVVVENPTHFTLRELFLKRFGGDRTDQMQPLRSLLESGIPLALGSDGPNNPYLNIMLASIYPGKPREAITREQAVVAYTLGSAYAEFSEKDKGSLEAGKLADLAVLSQDIFSVPPQDLPNTESVLTIVGGKIVYDERGAPTTAGAAGTGKPESTAFAPRYFFYKHCDATGLESLSFLSEAEVLKHGGVESLEATISKDTSWFYPIGSLLVPEWAVKPEGLAIPERRVRTLVNAWLKRGSPWKPGKFAGKFDAPPKGHPYRRGVTRKKTD
jgi:hypothetical protein